MSPTVLSKENGPPSSRPALSVVLITHSLALYLGRLPSHGAEAEWEQSVRICHQVNCTLALNWSPWYEKMPGHMGPADPTYSGPEEAEEMAMYVGLLANASAALVAAGRVGDFREGVERAAASIDGGEAKRKLDELARFTQQFSASD